MHFPPLEQCVLCFLTDLYQKVKLKLQDYNFNYNQTFTCFLSLSLLFSLPHLDAYVLVHFKGGSVALMVALWAVVVPVIPRGALPVHHLQGLQVPGQRGGGWRRERFRGWLEEGCVTSRTRRGSTVILTGRMFGWRRTTFTTEVRDSLDAPAGESMTSKQ